MSVGEEVSPNTPLHHVYKGKYKIEHLHPGPLYPAIHSSHRDSCKSISLFCFSHIKDVLKFKPLQRGKAFYLESRINLSDFLVKNKYTKNVFLDFMQEK